MSVQPRSISIHDVATPLLLVHSELFGPKTLRALLDLCKVQVRDEQEEERASLEWMYFGLFVFVEGIQDNFPHSLNVGIGVAIAREFLSQFEFHLANAAPNLANLEREIERRIRHYETAKAGGFEKVGFDVATSVLGLQVQPGNVPEGFEAYEVSIGANKARVAGLKAVNDFFRNHKIQT
ncbi:MAG: hypothetical protein WA192_10675 [Candidatus Acidiferrales bacterium]